MRTLRENVGRFYTYRVFQEHQIKERERDKHVGFFYQMRKDMGNH
jgi:hypothetical protein